MGLDKSASSCEII